MAANKGLLINAKAGLVSEVQVEDFTDIQRLIGCRTFTCVRLSATEVLYVDDEGLINGTGHGFSINYGDGALMGNGLILGICRYSGDTRDTAVGFKDLKGFGIEVAFNSEDDEIPLQAASNFN